MSDWGVLFLQKQKTFSLERATQVIGIAEVFGVIGNLMAGWLSDYVFRGSRVRPVVISGVLAVVLTGHRRAGKSCILELLAAELSVEGNVIYIDMDNLRIVVEEALVEICGQLGDG